MQKIDEFRAAKILIDQYGDHAESEANRRMQTFMDADDVQGAAVWLGIASAVAALQDSANAVTH